LQFFLLLLGVFFGRHVVVVIVVDAVVVVAVAVVVVVVVVVVVALNAGCCSERRRGEIVMNELSTRERSTIVRVSEPPSTLKFSVGCGSAIAVGTLGLSSALNHVVGCNLGLVQRQTSRSGHKSQRTAIGMTKGCAAPQRKVQSLLVDWPRRPWSRNIVWRALELGGRTPSPKAMKLTDGHPREGLASSALRASEERRGGVLVDSYRETHECRVGCQCCS
jgi:hypothetical protein